MKASDWKKSGHIKLIAGYNIFYIDTASEKPPLLICHGYPSCSFDYHKVLDFLRVNWRVIIHDQLGFGFSDKPTNYSYSLLDQAQMAIKLWEALGIDQAHLLGHDYGTSVICELIYQDNVGKCPIKLHSATLGNGSMLIHMAKLLPSQKLLMNPWTGRLLASFSNKAYFHHNFRKLWADQTKYPSDDIDELWNLLICGGGRKVLPKISTYIKQRYTYFDRWVNQGLYQSEIPINLFWADKDPIAVIEMAYVLERNVKQAQLSVINNVGHYPMMEAPETWARYIHHMLSLN